MTRDSLITLAQHFFVWGSIRRFEYGAAPAIQFNDRRATDIEMPGQLKDDARVFEDVLRVGFFAYEPRFWMLGEVEPLKRLCREASRGAEIERVLTKYQSTSLTPMDSFYRVRKNPPAPTDRCEYDSPPPGSRAGRLGSSRDPVLYGAPDLDICLHECRVAAGDDLFVATLSPARELELLDLAAVLQEPDEVSEFESLDLAMSMLFLAGKHAYAITRDISRAARQAGYDGIVYPSYFSMLRNGVKPFETTYGIWHRKIPQYLEFEKSKICRNYAIFGRPVADGSVNVTCINRLVLSAVAYSVHFGPALDGEGSWRDRPGTGNR